MKFLELETGEEEQALMRELRKKDGINVLACHYPE